MVGRSSRHVLTCEEAYDFLLAPHQNRLVELVQSGALVVAAPTRSRPMGRSSSTMRVVWCRSSARKTFTRWGLEAPEGRRTSFPDRHADELPWYRDEIEGNSRSIHVTGAVRRIPSSGVCTAALESRPLYLRSGRLSIGGLTSSKMGLLSSQPWPRDARAKRFRFDDCSPRQESSMVIRPRPSIPRQDRRLVGTSRCAPPLRGQPSSLRRITPEFRRGHGVRNDKGHWSGANVFAGPSAPAGSYSVGGRNVDRPVSRTSVQPSALSVHRKFPRSQRGLGLASPH